jgi:hypothetical protein
MVSIVATDQFFFDPLGSTDLRQSAVVFVDDTTPAPLPGGKRPGFIWSAGGGWAPSTGLPKGVISTDEEFLLWRLIKRGFIVLYTGYTVTDFAIPGSGAFDPFTWNESGSGELRLDSNPSKLAIRSGEKDMVHLLQAIQDVGVRDGSRDLSDWGIGGSSAMAIMAQFMAFGPNRADPNADPASRFARPTRPRYVVTQRTVSSFKAYITSGGIQHFTDGAGGITSTLADALAAPGGPQNLDQLSSGFIVDETPETAAMNATMPIWAGGEGTPELTLGATTPYWEGLENQLGINSSFFNSFEAFAAGLLERRYAARLAVGANGSPDPTFDAQKWPTVAAGEDAVIRCFTGMAVAGLYLDGDKRGLLNAYPPGTYVFEVTTDDEAADPVAYFGGDVTGPNQTRVQDQTSSQPAIYEVVIPEAFRSNAGIELVWSGGGSGRKITALSIYLMTEAATKATQLWTPSLVAFLSKFTRWRDMESRFGNETANDILSLADEPQMSWCTWDGIGPPREATIELCNLARMDYQLMIPARVCLDQTYIDDAAAKCVALLDPRLRVLPHAANEIWNGDGDTEFDSFRSAYVFEAEHADTLGYTTDFAGRMQAQAYATQLIIERFRAAFGAEADARVLNIVETQIGNTGVTELKLDHDVSGTVTRDVVDVVQVAPYFPNGPDSWPWWEFNPGWDQTTRETWFAGLLDYLAEEVADAVAGLQQTMDFVAAYNTEHGTSIRVEAYEGWPQEGVPNSFPAFNASLTYGKHAVVDFNGSVYRSNQPVSPGAWNRDQWDFTGAKPQGSYTSQENENAVVAMATMKSLAGYQALLESLTQQFWTITSGGCAMWYGAFKRPFLLSGARGVGHEWDEPATISTDATFTGPAAPLAAIENLSTRPNGEFPATGDVQDYGYGSIVDQLTDAHAPEFLFMLKQELEALPGSEHTTISRFVLNGDVLDQPDVPKLQTQQAIGEDQYHWILDVLGLGDTGLQSPNDEAETVIGAEEAPFTASIKGYAALLSPSELKAKFEPRPSFQGISAGLRGAIAVRLGGQKGQGPEADLTIGPGA